MARGQRRSGDHLTLARAVVAPSGGDDAPAVAVRIRRQVGTAVTRNRIRRRVLAAVRAHADLLEVGHAYLFSARPSAATRSFADLDADVAALLGAIRRGGGS